MKKSYVLEMLILFFAGSGGMVIWVIDKWYWGFLFGGALLIACSYMIGLLKKETLDEYIDAISQNSEEVKKNG